jgi:hypothetical protein
VPGLNVGEALGSGRSGALAAQATAILRTLATL